MDCPRCSGVEMNELFLEDETVVRLCGECHSLWIDTTDLTRILVHHNLPGFDALECRENLDEAVGTCPDDLTDFVVVESVNNDHYSFAMCEVCGNLWLTGGLDGDGFHCETGEEVIAELLAFFTAFSTPRRARL